MSHLTSIGNDAQEIHKLEKEKTEGLPYTNHRNQVVSPNPSRSRFHPYRENHTEATSLSRIIPPCQTPDKEKNSASLLPFVIPSLEVIPPHVRKIQKALQDIKVTRLSEKDIASIYGFINRHIEEDGVYTERFSGLPLTILIQNRKGFLCLTKCTTRGDPFVDAGQSKTIKRVIQADDPGKPLLLAVIHYNPDVHEKKRIDPRPHAEIKKRNFQNLGLSLETLQQLVEYEAQIQKIFSTSLSHIPHVHATLHNSQKGRSYIVMDYIKAKSLNNICENEEELKKLSEDCIVNMIVQILEVHRAIDKLKFVFNDWHLGNILIDDTGTVWLVDFGGVRPDSYYAELDPNPNGAKERIEKAKFCEREHCFRNVFRPLLVLKWSPKDKNTRLPQGMREVDQIFRDIYRSEGDNCNILQTTLSSIKAAYPSLFPNS